MAPACSTNRRSVARQARPRLRLPCSPQPGRAPPSHSLQPKTTPVASVPKPHPELLPLSQRDDNSSGGLSPNATFNQTYSVDSTGLGHLPANCTIGTTCQNVFYIVSPAKAVVINVNTTQTNPSIQVADK